MIQASTLWELVEKRAALTPDACFAVDESDRELSFSAYRDASLHCAAGLARLGVAPGSAVSWMLPTWLESLVLVAALSRLGALQNPVLPSYRRRELDFIVDQSGPGLLVVPRVWRGFDYQKLASRIAVGRELDVHVLEGEQPGARAARGRPDRARIPSHTHWWHQLAPRWAARRLQPDRDRRLRPRDEQRGIEPTRGHPGNRRHRLSPGVPGRAARSRRRDALPRGPGLPRGRSAKARRPASA